jgi:hypothetical protein
MVFATAAAALTLAAPIWGLPVDAGMLPPAASAVTEVLPVDLNGDGLLDVVVAPLNASQGDLSVPVAPVFLINRGRGRFVDATQDLFGGPAPAVDWARELLTADFNRDGHADIFIADHGHANDNNPNQVRTGGQDHLLLSTADGHLVDATANLPQQFSFTHSAAVADVNRFSVEPDALRGFITDIYGQDHSYACVFADVNGDGAPDLVVGGGEERGANASQVLLNDGHGRFTFFTTLPPTIGPPNNAFVIDMKAADVNGDSHVDLVFGETFNDPWYVGTNIQVLINDGTGRFSDETAARLQSPPAQARSWPQRVLLTDINDDGRPDLTIQYAPQGVVLNADPTVVWVNDDGIFKPVAAPKDGYGSPGGGIAWVNGDGPHALFSVENHPLGEAVSHYYVTPQIVMPGAPQQVRITRVGTTMRITWEPVAGATSYVVLRNGVRIAKTAATRFVDRKPGRHPSYRVRAINAAGASP